MTEVPDRFFRHYARRRARYLDALYPVQCQQHLLLHLIGQARACRFAEDHDFARIQSVRDFQSRVPLRDYESFWHSYWEPEFPRIQNQTWSGRIPFFALSSGTSSGRSKYLPLSWTMLRAQRRAALDTLVWHQRACPWARPMRGRFFFLGGSTDLRSLAPGIRAGDLSGIAAATLPRWARPFVYPPRRLALLGDWEAKLRILAADSPGHDIRRLAGTPSWLLLLLRAVAAQVGNPPFPRLELLLHGGVPFAPYRPLFAPFLTGTRAELREVYAASEAFIASADGEPEAGLRLHLQHGAFFEFVPVAELGRERPRRHWLRDCVSGEDYALVLTTAAGLWSYLIGDVVRVLTRRPPRIHIVGRLQDYLSVFGEHLHPEELAAAVARAAATGGMPVAEWMVGPSFAEDRPGLGHHVFLLESAAPLPPSAELRPRLELMTKTLDEELRRRNADYDEHRALQLTPPELHVLAPGSFAHWLKTEGRLGGQNKVPRVVPDPQRFAQIWERLSKGESLCAAAPTGPTAGTEPSR
ncbi:MAG: GH3 auxin-responsive promoter family protein [Acidithiobacillus caldus]|nr:GH3 auxin-responsive promoter family protein [Acidithiobacillus caldus]